MESKLINHLFYMCLIPFVSKNENKFLKEKKKKWGKGSCSLILDYISVANLEVQDVKRSVNLDYI